MPIRSFGGLMATEGIRIEELLASLDLHQLICEPTNFGPNKNPTCIDLIITDQPNLILDCGTRPSLDSYCHHQIIHCKINLRIPPPPLMRGKFGISIEQIQLPLEGARFIFHGYNNLTLTGIQIGK